MCLPASLFLFRKWKSSIATSGNYPLNCPYPDEDSVCGYVVNNDQTLIRHALSAHNCKVHVRHGCITSFEELETADAERRKALYGIRRGGEGDDRRTVTSQLKHKKSAVKSTKDFVGKVIPVQGKCSTVKSNTAEENVEKQQTHRNVFDKFADVSENFIVHCWLMIHSPKRLRQQTMSCSNLIMSRNRRLRFLVDVCQLVKPTGQLTASIPCLSQTIVVWMTDEFESEFVSDNDLDRQYNGDYLSEEDNNDAEASGGDECVLVEHADIDDEDGSFIIISDVDEA